ncbi:MAG: sugar ABC transporter substrate-binding protein [Candidatus Acetothermia bacterium]|nr:sugar ABC transporter substrate-binding protein [Candidatus Acetothermia bacterium]
MKRKLLAVLLVLVALSGVGTLGWAKIKIVFSDWHLVEPHWEKALKEAVAQFMAENPDIEVELEYVSYGEKETKYITAIEAGVGPDVMHLGPIEVSFGLFASRGYLYDLTPLIEAEGPGFVDPWYPAALEAVQYNGRYYAMPGDFMSMFLMYNKRLFAEAGLDPARPPRTWDEFLSYAKALTRDRDGDGRIDTWGFGTVGKVDPGFQLRFTPLLLSFGADYLTPDYKCCVLNSPEAKEAFKFWVELYTVHGVIPPGVTDMTPGKVREQFAAEKVAMILTSGWGPPIIASIKPGVNWDEIIGFAPVPVKAGTDPKLRTTAWLSCWAINRNTKNPEAAWRLVKFITSKAMEEKWFRDANVLSSRRDVTEVYAPILASPSARINAAELARAKLVPLIPEWPQVIEAVNIAVQKGFIGVNPDQALAEAYRQINAILDVYRTTGESCPSF